MSYSSSLGLYILYQDNNKMYKCSRKRMKNRNMLEITYTLQHNEVAFMFFADGLHYNRKGLHNMVITNYLSLN